MNEQNRPILYHNRELSWLEFNYRVLSEARDKSLPLFERLKFLSITASNLDEFFMVRVASLKDMVHAKYVKPDIAGMTPTQQLDAIAVRTHQLVDLAIQSAQEAGLVKHGDLVVVTAGVPVGISGTTNMIRIAQVGGSLVNAIGVGSQIASGPLCVCRTLEEIPEKFHPGDVLVVPYTNNEVLPWLRQAAAIVSEEASADCHTATVGLLLNKPVIVAASDATRRLKDGTFVSVDCARGIVQVIPQ